MKAKALIIIMMVLLFISCSPVTSESIEETGTAISADKSIMISSSNNGRYINLVFKAVSGAKQYAASINEINDGSIFVLDTEFSNGIYTASIDITGVASENNTTYSVMLYAASSLLNPEWTELFTIDADYQRDDIDSIAPEATLVKRGTDFAEVEILNAPESDMTYQVTIDGISYGQFSSGSFTIKGLEETESYTAEIAHKYNDGEYGVLTKELIIGEYEGEQTLTLEVNDGYLTVSGLKSDYSEIELVKNETDRVVFSSKISGSSQTYTFKDAFSAFDIGTFRVRAKGSSSTVISNNKFYVTDLDAIKNTTEIGRQHYKVTFPVAEDVDISSITVKGATLKSSGDNAVLLISDLTSMTTYSDYNVTLTLSGSGSSMVSFNFTTKSFAGDYKWTTTKSPSSGYYASQFYVTVVENDNSTSKYRYYILENEDSNKYRIMPLIDSAIDTVTENPVPYGDDENLVSYQKTYQWNNNKWNASSFNVDSWSIVDSRSTAYTDAYVTYVESTALGSMTVVTQTSFTFTEDEDLNPSIIYYNKIIEGDNDYSVKFGNYYLRKNPDPKGTKGEMNEYYFALEVD